jgi:hypothetical protein
MNGYLTHHMSGEAVKSEMDLYTVPPTQISIQECFSAEYFPVSSIENQTQIEFFVKGSAEDYIDPSKIFLNVKARIVSTVGGKVTVLADDALVTPVNNLLHSMFSEVNVFLGDKLVSTSNNQYPHKAYFTALMMNSGLADKSYLAMEMFYKDKKSAFSDRDPTKAESYDGLKKRYLRSKNSRIMDMTGRLHVDIFNQDKLLPNNLDITLKLKRSTDAFCLLKPTADTGDYKLEIIAASLSVQKVRINPKLAIEHAKPHYTFKYPINRMECRLFTETDGKREIFIPNMFLGNLPMFVAVGLVDHDAYNGSFNRNPFEFHHKNMNYVSLFIDGVQYPSIAPTPNFTTNEWARLYQTLFLAANKYYGTDGLGFTYDEYAEGNTLMLFDLTGDQSGLAASHFNLAKNGAMSLSIKLSKNLDATINVFVLGIYQNIIEIDSSRNVILDYA